ncbi:nitrite reductase [Luteococcus peritonei]|uniref:Nitrite reductase n=1 Tax=Luteococcus peritonei TaxID=88874 RepID=A0ABW4RTP4_9ACTN
MRTRPDRCPGVLRPWPADDGLLVRIRLVAGRLTTDQLRQLSRASQDFGDGIVRSTNRANLQLRAFGDDGTGHLRPEALAAITATGLLPSPRHDLVRNIMASPLTGIAGGRADLRGLVDELDRLLLAYDSLTGLPGKFLFVLDDGRGDVLAHPCDLGIVALDERIGQLRIGSGWGDVVELDRAPGILVELAAAFVAKRGEQPTAPWHVAEMETGFRPPQSPEPGLPPVLGSLPFGPVEQAPGWRHEPFGEAGLDAAQVERITTGVDQLLVTPWHGVLVPPPVVEREAVA